MFEQWVSARMQELEMGRMDKGVGPAEDAPLARSAVPLP